VDTPDGPLTPQTPLPVLPPKQKGYHSVFFFEICIHLHTHQDLKLQCRRVNGQKLRYGRPCPHDSPLVAESPGTHNWLAQLHFASFLSEFHWLFHAGTILEVWSELLLHWLDSPSGLHPSACASDFWTCPQTPPPLLPKLLKKGPNRLGLSWGFRWYIKNSGRFWEGASKKLRTTPPPLLLIYIPIDSASRQNSDYIIFNQNDTCGYASYTLLSSSNFV